MSERAPIVYIVDDDQGTRRYFNAVLPTAPRTSKGMVGGLSIAQPIVAGARFTLTLPR